MTAKFMLDIRFLRTFAIECRVPLFSALFHVNLREYHHKLVPRTKNYVLQVVCKN